MDLEQLRQELVSVADKIEDLIIGFESKTGCTVSGIGLNRIDITKVGPQSEQSIVNVDLRVEL